MAKGVTEERGGVISVRIRVAGLRGLTVQDNIPHHLTFTHNTTTTPHIPPRQTSYLSKSTTAAVLKLDTSPLKAEAL